VIGVWALGGSFHLIGTFLTIGTYDTFFIAVAGPISKDN
jgi:hypothetical protein